jgi:hypothetical protein
MTANSTSAKKSSAKPLDCTDPYALGKAAWHVIFTKHLQSQPPALKRSDPHAAQIEMASFYKLVPGITPDDFIYECRTLIESQRTADGKPRYTQAEVEALMNQHFPFRNAGASKLP